MAEFDGILNNVRTWVREIGKYQVENLGKKDLFVETKSTAIDLVTEVDRHSEEYLLEKIKENYPEHQIVSEESGDNRQYESDYCWIIDPLDGTTNYAQGLPIFAISIALAYKKETVLGVVYLPVLDLLFEGIRGNGSYVNGRKLNTGCKSDLRECLLATGFPYDIAETEDNNLDYFSRIAPQARGIRRIGTATYDLANVAAGILDGYWELNLQPWDVAAGILLVEEAGGRVIPLREKRGISLIAGNSCVADLLQREILSADTEKEQAK